MSAYSVRGHSTPLGDPYSGWSRLDRAPPLHSYVIHDNDDRCSWAPPLCQTKAGMSYDSASGPLHDVNQYMQGLWQPDGAFATLIRIGSCIGCSCHVRMRLRRRPLRHAQASAQGCCPYHHFICQIHTLQSRQGWKPSGSSSSFTLWHAHSLMSRDEGRWQRAYNTGQGQKQTEPGAIDTRRQRAIVCTAGSITGFATGKPPDPITVQ